MKYSKIDHVNKPVSKIVFGTATPKMFAAFRSVYGDAPDFQDRLKADIWNREILPVKTEETGAMGSAILGFAAVTGEKDRCELAKKFVRIGEPIRPNPENVELYQMKYQKFKRLRKLILEESR